MSVLYRSHLPSILKFHETCSKVSSISVQLRWKKIPIRKPRWLPMAPSKLFRIPQHPYVPPDELNLIDDLMDEYYRKIDSLRKILPSCLLSIGETSSSLGRKSANKPNVAVCLKPILARLKCTVKVFKEELAQKNRDEGRTLENLELEETKFLSLLEENKKENERVGKIREETIERLFQEKQMEFLQMEEDRKLKEQETKLRVEELVRIQKEKIGGFITYENIDDAIEKALNDPRNICYCIDVSGNVKWEGNPPDDLEEEIKRRISESMGN